MRRDFDVDVNSWEEFEEQLRERLAERDSHKASTGRGSSKFLFRGQNCDDCLKTTLERSGREKYPIREYYGLISRIKAQIETFTGIKWGEPVKELEEWLGDNPQAAGPHFPAFSFLAYLRHHGFPSPLLDWTRSPYIAAYFAFKFRDMPQDEGKVSIYVLWLSPEGFRSRSGSRPRIRSLEQDVRTHRRHFLQQSVYTISTCLDSNGGEWLFAPHEEAFGQSQSLPYKQDLLYKYNIPRSETLKVLKLLDEYNLNAFSLFGSEESLMETMAVRELHFPKDQIHFK